MRFAPSLALFGLMFVGGCALNNASSGYRLDERSNEGLLVFSVSYQGLENGGNSSWRFRSLAADKTYDIITHSRFEFAPDWSDPPGRLVVLTLPSGDYEFYRVSPHISGSGQGMSWTIGAGGVAQPVPGSIPDEEIVERNKSCLRELGLKPLTIPFHVVAGRATYIGNLHLVGPTWTYDKPRSFRLSCWVERKDQSNRDLALFRSRYPNVAPENILRRTKGQE